MAINKKLIHFNKKETFENELAKGNILPTSIIFIKNTKEIWTHGQYYDCNSPDLSNYITKEELEEELNNKVDKVTGKQLSTEDFTTILKQKLEGLTNYDDTKLSERIEGLKGRLDTILDDDNVTIVIDTFQEIEKFLQGITNTQTLTGLLQEMKDDIVKLCTDSYYTKQQSDERYWQRPNLVLSKENDGAFNIINSYHNKVGIRFIYNNNGTEQRLGFFGYDTGNGVTLYNQASNARIGIKDDGIFYYCVGNASNINNLKQIAFTTSNVASADKLTTKLLASGTDLNDIKDTNFSTYYANGSVAPTVLNKPSSINGAFGLQVQRVADGYRLQIITSANGVTYRRYWNNVTWSEWKRLLTEDDLTDIKNRLTALENKQ